MVTLYIKLEKTDGSEMLFALSNVKTGISLSTLRDKFLTAAKPVLKVEAVDSAYYIDSTKTKVEEPI